jgi:hypothetical protein
VDAKAPERLTAAVDAIVDCYAEASPGSMMVVAKEKPVSVYWGHIRYSSGNVAP